MTITTSINAVGILRATQIVQSARADAARGPEGAPRIVSVEIDRSVDAQAELRDSARTLPSSQKRAVDIRV